MEKNLENERETGSYRSLWGFGLRGPHNKDYNVSGSILGRFQWNFGRAVT